VLVEGIVMGLFYLTLLAVTGELGKADLALVRKVVGRG